jgi:NAD(P)-dependent dehydrogenase (short-subunit alcohol dehydrogenase family)
MADHGAKYLIFVNRSGIPGESAQKTMRKLQSKSVTVTVHACDIADEAQVSKMLSIIAETEPPIRGLIHGAMILKVEKPTI